MPLVTANTADLPAESQAHSSTLCGAAGLGRGLLSVLKVASANSKAVYNTEEKERQVRRT